MNFSVRLIGALMCICAALPAQTPSSEDEASAQRHGANKDSFLVKSLGLLQPEKPVPLTRSRRFHNYIQSTAGVLPVFSAAFSAGFSQLINSPPEWHRGTLGYSRRFANNLAFNAVRTTLTYGASAALHEDNRYFASGRKRFWQRTLYALSSTVIARHDDGSRSVSLSVPGGVVGAALLSRTWSPPSWQGGKNVAATVGLTLTGTAGFNVAREFVPDIIRYLRLRKN